MERASGAPPPVEGVDRGCGEQGREWGAGGGGAGPRAHVDHRVRLLLADKGEAARARGQRGHDLE